MSVRESFNPESYELDKNFRLTRFAELKGTGCKVGSNTLWKHIHAMHSLQETYNTFFFFLKCGCFWTQVPQEVLQKLLETLQENHFQEDEQFLGAVMPRLGIW